MTGTCPDLLAALRQRRRDLELDAMAVKSRIAEVNDMIELIEQPQRRRGRPPGPRAVFTPRRVTPPDPPLHVAGGVNEPPDDDELPFQLDAPGA
jgi:hypothetical protein